MSIETTAAPWNAILIRDHNSPTLTLLNAWWPLALSWICLAFESIIITFVVSRMPNATVELAAFGGLVYPLLILIESPIYMILSAANTLCDDVVSFQQVRRYSLFIATACSLVQLLLVFPPIYHFVMTALLSPPPAAADAAYTALLFCVPTSILVTVRRFYQGLLVRFGQSRSVGLGTFYRIIGMMAALLLLYKLEQHAITGIHGATVGAIALLFGVTIEAAFAAILAHKRVVHLLPATQSHAGPLTLFAFLAFYIPLALTPLLGILSQPIASGFLGRLPDELASLVIWPVVWQLLWALTASANAIPEVVVSALKRGESRQAIAHFTLLVTAALFLAVPLVAYSPLSAYWFANVAQLSHPLAAQAQQTFLLASIFPALRALQCGVVGEFLYYRRTVLITLGVLVYLFTNVACLLFAFTFFTELRLTPTELTAVAVTTAALVHSIWLSQRVRKIER